MQERWLSVLHHIDNDHISWSQVTILPDNELSVGSLTVTPWCVLWIICSYLASVQYGNRQNTDIKGYGFIGLQISNTAIPPATTHLFHNLVHLTEFPTHTMVLVSAA